MPKLNNDKSTCMLAAVSRFFGCTKQKLPRCFRQNCSFRDSSQSGRHCVTTGRKERYITLIHLRRWFLPAVATERRYCITAQTVWNQSMYLGHSKSGVLPRAHQAARMNLWSRHLGFRRADWTTVMFTEEPRFNISHADNRVRVYHRRGEWFPWRLCPSEEPVLGWERNGLVRHSGQFKDAPLF